MAGMFVGIGAGETREGSAGRNQRALHLSVASDGATARIGAKNVALGADTFVMWHKGSAGTFHGVVDPEKLKHGPLGYQGRPGAGQLVPAQCSGVVETSMSGGDAMAAIVIRVDRPLAIVTSGYDGRKGWKVMLLAPDGAGGIAAETLSIADLKARYAPVEAI